MHLRLLSWILVVLMTLLPQYFVLVISGDFNGKVGSRRNLIKKYNQPQETLMEGDRSITRVIADLRSTVELDCPFSSVLTPKHEWYKMNLNGIGDIRLTQFRDRFELYRQGQVRIRDLTYEDAGIYVCKVANSKEAYYIQLMVSGEVALRNNVIKSNGATSRIEVEESYSEPEIIKDHLPKDKIELSTGEPIISLKCESRGYPMPTITWYKDNKMQSSFNGNLSPLTITNLSNQDSGIYKCESVNIFGISIYEVTLEVADSWHGAAEILEMNPSNLTIFPGSSVNISCVARFSKQPSIYLVKKVKADGNETFYHSETLSHYKVLQGGRIRNRGEHIYSIDLVLPNVTKKDSGDYFCAVIGPQGYNFTGTTIIVGSDHRSVAAQWAIVWTSSFIILVLLILLCIVRIRIYGCHQKKSGMKMSHSQKTSLPETSPQTTSTNCTSGSTGHHEITVPLMVGSSTHSPSYFQCNGRSSLSDAYVPSRHNTSEVSSVNSSNSSFMADLELSRSYISGQSQSSLQETEPGCRFSNVDNLSRSYSKSPYSHCSCDRSSLQEVPTDQNPLFLSSDSGYKNINIMYAHPCDLSTTDYESYVSYNDLHSKDCYRKLTHHYRYFDQDSHISPD